MRRLSILLSALALSACATGQQALTAAGVSPTAANTIAVDTAKAGQLFCQFGPTLMAISGVSVIGASASSVAAACSVAQAVGALTPPTSPPVPVPGPAGAVAVLATVPPQVAAAVAASIVGAL